MTSYPDVMVDIETTGTDPAFASIRQIAAVKFNYATGEIGPMFDRCLWMPASRFWEDSTFNWWQKMPELSAKIDIRAENPRQVMEDFVAWAGQEYQPRFWAKPTTFDFSFIASYCRMYELDNPFHFRFARDLNSFMAALAGGAEHQDMKHVPFVGSEHNAIDDCLHQITMLFEAKNGNFNG